jgi:hypothetical protein
MGTVSFTSSNNRLEKDMDYTITPSTDGKFIILKVKGNITRQTMMPANLDAHRLGRQLKVSRYLVDATEARNAESALGNFEFAYSEMLMTEGIDKFAQVAILVSPNDHSHDFTELVFKNAGLNATIFTDRGQATQFLT